MAWKTVDRISPVVSPEAEPVLSESVKAKIRLFFDRYETKRAALLPALHIVQDALGHVHPNINEAKVVASYHQSSRYHSLPVAQMQAAVTLMATGGEYAQVGKEFLNWASEDLQVYARYSYDWKAKHFVALMTDGTPLQWRESREGYYVPASFAPRAPDSLLLWGYALAYRQ